MIRLTSSTEYGNFGLEVTEFADLDDLESELDYTAKPEYREDVMSALRSGASTLIIQNGPYVDTYEQI